MQPRLARIAVPPPLRVRPRAVCDFSISLSAITHNKFPARCSLRRAGIVPYPNTTNKRYYNDTHQLNF